MRSWGGLGEEKLVHEAAGPLESSLQPPEEESEGLMEASVEAVGSELSPSPTQGLLPSLPILGQRDKCCQSVREEPAGFRANRPRRSVCPQEQPLLAGTGRRDVLASDGGCLLTSRPRERAWGSQPGFLHKLLSRSEPQMPLTVPGAPLSPRYSF